MPTVQELNRLKQCLSIVETCEQFETQMCWLDEYDEISIGDISTNTPFITASTKALIYWLFSYSDGEFNKNALITFLERYISDQPLSRYYHDFISFGY